MSLRSRWGLGLVLTDVAALLISLMIAVWFCYNSGCIAHTVLPRYRLFLHSAIWILVWLIWSYMLRLYAVPRRWHLRNIHTDAIRILTIHMATVFSLLVLLRVGVSRPFLYSRAGLLGAWMISYCLVVLLRFFFGRLHMRLLSNGRGATPVLLVGSRSAVDRTKEDLKRCKGFCFIPKGEFTVTSGVTGLELEENLKGVLRTRGIDHIWLAADSENASVMADLVTSLGDDDVNWIMAAGAFSRFARDVECGESQPSEDDLEILHERVAHLARIIDHDIEMTFRMRVAVIGSRGIPASYGGVERYVEELTKRLVANDVDVSVYCRGHYTGKLNSYAGVGLRTVPCINTKHLEAATHTFLSSLHELYCHDDIVHYQAIGPALFCWIPRIFGRKILVTVQGLDWQRRKWGRFARLILRFGELLSAYASHATIVVSSDLKEHYKRRYGAETILIPNGVESRPFRPAQSIRRYQLEGDDYILCVGRLVPEKGIHTLIEAYRRIITEKTLVIAGGSSHSDEYVQHLKDLAHDAPILFTGYVYGAVLDELFSNASLYVSASEMEGLPITLLEAMSFGLCPLVSDIPPHREVLKDDGFFFPVADVDKLVRMLERRLQSPERQRIMKMEMKKRVVELYGWDSIVGSTLHHYQNLLS